MSEYSRALLNDRGEIIHLFTDVDVIALEGALDLVKRHTCIIAMPAADPVEFGSATVVRVGDFAVLVTAGHVLKNRTLSDLGMFGWYERDGYRYPIPMGGCRSESNVDVGALLFDAGVLEDSRLEGVGLDRIDICTSQVGDDLAVICGTSSPAIHKDDERLTIDCPLGSIGTKTVPEDKWPERIGDEVTSSSRDLFLYYSQFYAWDHKFRPRVPTDPKGMSGGGIWRLPLATKENELWSPHLARLIGIQSSREDRKWRWLRAVQMQHWVRLVWEAWDQVRPAMEAAGIVVEGNKIRLTRPVPD